MSRVAAGMRRGGRIGQQGEADQRTRSDDRHLDGRGSDGQRGNGRGHDHDRARHVGRERPPHHEHCLGDDRDRRQLEPAHPARVGEVCGFGQERKPDEDDRRREGEPQPAEDAAEPTGPERADRDPELAAGRTGEGLAEREEVGEARLVEPSAALDVLAAEVGDVGDRPAERRQAEAERCAEDFGQRGTIADARRQIAPTPDTCKAIHSPIMIANSPPAIVAIRRTSRAT